MKYIVGGIYLVLLIIIFGVLLSVKKYRDSVKLNWKALLIFTISSMIVMNFLLFAHLSQEQFISFWEFGGYWKKSLELNDLLDSSVVDALEYVFRSMQYSEYSYLPELFLSTPLYLVGDTYPQFVLLMFNCFIVVFNLLVYSLSLMILDDYQKKNNLALITIGLVLSFFSANIAPMILGYIGSVALPLIISVVILVYCKVLENKFSLYTIYIGLSFILMVLLRRWYSYFVVIFFLGSGISYMLKAIIEKEDIKKVVIPRFLNLFVCGIIPLVLLVFGFPSLFQTFISYDYAFAYGDIRTNPMNVVKWFTQNYGVLYVGLMAVGVYITIKNKKTRWESLGMLIGILFTVIAFNQIQAMGAHHYYIINTYLLIFLLVGVVGVLDYSKKLNNKILPYMIPVGLSLIIMVNTSYIFVHYRAGSVRKVTQSLIASSFPELRIRDDIEAVQEITTFLKLWVGESSVYVLATSEYFSEDILMNSLLPEDLRPIPNMAQSHVWDKRDGVPKQFFHYQYIVVANPIQFQFEPESHRVVSILAEEIMDGGILNPYYEKIMTYEITKGIQVYIYKKNAEVPSKVVDQISDQFKKIYPDYPFLYEFDY